MAEKTDEEKKDGGLGRQTVLEDKHYVMEDILHAPIVFVDGVQGLTIRDGVVRMTFYNMVFDPSEGSMHKKAVTNMVVSIGSLQGILGFLQGVMTEVQANPPLPDQSGPSQEG